MYSSGNIDVRIWVNLSESRWTIIIIIIVIITLYFYNEFITCVPILCNLNMSDINLVTVVLVNL